MDKRREFKSGLTAVTLVGAFLSFGCGTGDQKKSSAAPAEKAIRITAPEPVRQMWKGWNGKYVIFVHREKPVRQFSDFSGRNFLCAMIEIDMAIGVDMGKLCKAGDVTNVIQIANDPGVYDEHFLENPDSVAVMVPRVADYYGFRDNSKLIEVIIE